MVTREGNSNFLLWKKKECNLCNEEISGMESKKESKVWLYTPVNIRTKAQCWLTCFLIVSSSFASLSLFKTSFAKHFTPLSCDRTDEEITWHLITRQRRGREAESEQSRKLLCVSSLAAVCLFSLPPSVCWSACLSVCLSLHLSFLSL